jgi:lysyl-tRNA synthetase class I
MEGTFVWKAIYTFLPGDSDGPSLAILLKDVEADAINSVFVRKFVHA